MRSLVVIGLLATTGELLAQQYEVFPNDSIVADAPFDDITHFSITQTNLAGSKLLFSWRQISMSVPAGWTASLCDNGYCYTDFPLSGTMDTVYKGDYGLMSVRIDPKKISGRAVIRYELWEAGSPERKDTLTWIITAGGSTGIEEARSNQPFIIYPNPVANEVINIHALTDVHFILSDLTGKQVHNGALHKGANLIPAGNLSKGSYTITVYSKEGKYYTQKLIIKY